MLSRNEMSKAKLLRSRIRGPGVLRVGGAGDALTARLIMKNGYDAIWASGLSISALRGVPDCSVLSMDEFLSAARTIDAVTSLPLIADCDTGFGGLPAVIRMVREYEDAGIAAVCIEDKAFPKRNSFLDGQKLAEIGEFTEKIRAAKRAQTDVDFMLFARIESLITGAGVVDAVQRAIAYAEAGADVILVHSKAQVPDEVLEVTARFRADYGDRVPIAIIPTTYYATTCDVFAANGIKLVIYANQTLRAAVRAIDSALFEIIRAGMSAPIEQLIAPLSEVFSLIGMETQASTTEPCTKDGEHSI